MITSSRRIKIGDVSNKELIGHGIIKYKCGNKKCSLFSFHIYTFKKTQYENFIGVWRPILSVTSWPKHKGLWGKMFSWKKNVADMGGQEIIITTIHWNRWLCSLGFLLIIWMIPFTRETIPDFDVNTCCIWGINCLRASPILPYSMLIFPWSLSTSIHSYTSHLYLLKHQYSKSKLEIPERQCDICTVHTISYSQYTSGWRLIFENLHDVCRKLDDSRCKIK